MKEQSKVTKGILPPMGNITFFLLRTTVKDEGCNTTVAVSIEGVCKEDIQSCIEKLQEILAEQFED